MMTFNAAKYLGLLHKLRSPFLLRLVNWESTNIYKGYKLSDIKVQLPCGTSFVDNFLVVNSKPPGKAMRVVIGKNVLKHNGSIQIFSTGPHQMGSEYTHKMFTYQSDLYFPDPAHMTVSPPKIGELN